MELLLLIALFGFAYVMWKRSRGEEPTLLGMAGGCLGLGCLGVLVMFVVGIVVLWLLLQAVADLDISLTDFGGGGGSGEKEVPGRET